MSLDRIALPLFLPANRLDRLDKALGAGADAVILDLEDAVPEEEKETARAGLAGALPEAATVPILIRINAAGTPWFENDCAAVANLNCAAVVLPKAERGSDCEAAAARTGKPVIGLIESALGLDNARDVARSSVRLAFGSIDFAADMGCGHDRTALALARSSLVMASRLAGLAPPWDGVTTATRDEALIADDCRHGLMMGFGGKLLIHPAQIAPARAALTPAEAERDWAVRIVAAADGAGGMGAVKVDGEMVDAPVVLRARQILARAEAAG